MALVQPLLELNLLQIFSTPNNNSALVSMKFANAINSYLATAQITPDGILTVNTTMATLPTNLAQIFSTPNNNATVVASKLSQAISTVIMSLVFTSPTLGVLKVTFFNQPLLQLDLAQIFSTPNNNATVVAKQISMAIHKNVIASVPPLL